MSVKLWSRPDSDRFPGGFQAVHTDVESATAQAVADIQQGATPGPDRIVDGEGNLLVSRADLEAAATE
jgi:hypothetical protein